MTNRALRRCRWSTGRAPDDETNHAPARPGIARVVRLWDGSWTRCSLRANADARRAGPAPAGRRGPAGPGLPFSVSGDGRIPITAAKEFGARGVGIEIDRALVTQAQANARGAGVEDRVEFRLGDMYVADVRSATVVTLFLHPGPNLKLREKLRSELPAGSRIVSYVWDMGGWTRRMFAASASIGFSFGGSRLVRADQRSCRHTFGTVRHQAPACAASPRALANSESLRARIGEPRGNRARKPRPQAEA